MKDVGLITRYQNVCTQLGLYPRQYRMGRYGILNKLLIILQGEDTLALHGRRGGRMKLGQKDCSDLK
jgi:hypothetical protein